MYNALARDTYSHAFVALAPVVLAKGQYQWRHVRVIGGYGWVGARSKQDFYA